MVFGVDMIKKKKEWNGDPNTWDGKFHPIRGKKWWNGDPNTWDGKFYIPEKTKRDIERKIKDILG
jgi:glucose dehydrogenase